MNEKQNIVIATTVAGVLLVLLYLCPWRVEQSQEVKFSPIYQAPISYIRSYDTEHGKQGSSRMKPAESHIVIELLALELIGLGVAGGLLYLFISDSDNCNGQ